MKQRDAIQLHSNRSATRRARVALCRLAACLVLASVASTRAWAQEEEEARNPVPPQIVIAPKSAVPDTIGAAEPERPAEVGNSASHPVRPEAVKSATPSSTRPVEVENAMRLVTGVALWSGSLSAEQAWDSGTLTVEDVLALLQQPVGSADGPRNEEVRRDLAGLLVRHAPESVKDTGKLSAMTRSALAHLYSNEKDVRAVELCEGLMSELDAKLKASAGKTISPWPWLWGIIHLAEYYQNTGEVQKAAETWLRGEAYFSGTSPGGAAGVLIDAARLYVQMGGKANQQKAQELYGRVSKYGNGWMTGLALYDQAMRLIVDNRFEEARRLLIRNVSGEGAEPMRVGMLVMLSYSFYRDGELDNATKHAKEAIALCQTLKNPLQNVGLEAPVNMAKSILVWIERWKAQPIIAAPQVLRLAVQDEMTTVQQFRIKTLRAIPLMVSSSSPGLKTEVKDVAKDANGKEAGLPFFEEKEVIVKIESKALKKDFDAMLVVTSPDVAGVQVNVPVHVEVPDPIQLSSKNVFFGFVKVGEPATAKFTLNAKQPFRILRVESDSAALRVNADVQKFAQEHEVALTLNATGAGRVYEGKIQVVTNLPVQESFDVAYYGAVE